MLAQLKQISKEQWFWILALVLSNLLAFLLGYFGLQFLIVDLCQSPMKIVDFVPY